ncbi:MAG: hypothetical protein ABJO28_00835 [Maribacter dokdonensis]|uniref:hypothetical protein n=1 Tax=Maribacter dokdonensis TaxID=320912 RepID=UPI0032636AD0
MKTYNFVACFVLALSFVACDKSTNEQQEETSTNIAVDYTVFLKTNDNVNAVIVRDNEGNLATESEVVSLGNIPTSAIKIKSVNGLGYFYTANCEAALQWYNSENQTSGSVQLFNDLNACDVSVASVTYNEDNVFAAYEVDLAGKDKHYVVRVSSLDNPSAYSEVTIDNKPVDIVESSGKLFVLTLNEFVSNEYHLSVIDLNTLDVMVNVDLGYDALRLFKNDSGEIIVSYPELHTTIDPMTLDKVYTTYGEDTAPGFISTQDYHIGNDGKFYFQKYMSDAAIKEVPATYDFNRNGTVVYLFENFLSDSELNVKYNIAGTTAIAYDDKNNYMLIGYQKRGANNEGGILRITPSPDFKLIDNIDVSGIPQTIFIN